MPERLVIAYLLIAGLVAAAIFGLIYWRRRQAATRRRMSGRGY